MPHQRTADKRRRSIRLRGWDYRNAGAYSVTTCAHRRRLLFGGAADGVVRLNACGEIVEAEWFRNPELRPYVALDAFVVMPNHVHGILWIAHAVL